MKNFILFAFFFCTSIAYTQNSFTAFVKDKETKQLLIGADGILEGTNIGASADINGKIRLENIPNGYHSLVFSYMGYESDTLKLHFPLKEKKTVTIYLDQNISLQTVTVYSTRTANRIEEIPTRVEVLGKEEVVEETAFNPGNISKLLGDTSGIQIQNTSAISGTVSFSIQGLPGKYTQLLQDGFPMYSGFSSGLSLLQIPPLNLQQVEIVKGSASTLYGSDAIAGIVNLITKKPTEKPEFSILLNKTHKGGQDLSSYYSSKNGPFGITFLAGFSTQAAKDISGNSFTDIPQYNRAVVSPKLFYNFSDTKHIAIGLSSTLENRIGGDIKAVNNNPNSNHSFFVDNKTNRINGTVKYKDSKLFGNAFTAKASVSYFDRKLKTPVNSFIGVQNTVFTELSYLIKTAKQSWVSGLNYYYDNFHQQQPTVNLLNYSNKTVGVFTQDNLKLGEKLFIEPGIRYDYNFKYGGFFLPRLAVMFHFSNTFFTRFSGGLGYKLPTPFTDDAERTRYQQVIMPTNLKVEKSSGLNLDFNYKTPLFNNLLLSFNQGFFITQINKPIIANSNLLKNQIVSYQNANGSILSKGFNTNFKFTLNELILYVDYTHLISQKSFDANNPLAYMPQNKLTTTLAYEDEENGWKTGLEAFYFGNQFRENGTKTPNYWLLGASVQKTIGHFTLALNVENILNIRQTHYENIVSGSTINPIFNQLYAPLDGIVGNMVLKFDLN